MTGELSILNVGIGDIRVTFNQHDPAEAAKALRMLKDMQARGYAILVQLDDGTYTRAIDIDDQRGTYVILEPDPLPTQPDAATEPPEAEATAAPPPGKRRGRPRKHLPVATTRATAVARSAGG